MFYLVREDRVDERFFWKIVDDDTRVRLQRGPNDYINANLVEVPEVNRSYILTQVYR